jgi:hypothetical protein
MRWVNGVIRRAIHSLLDEKSVTLMPVALEPTRVSSRGSRAPVPMLSFRGTGLKSNLSQMRRLAYAAIKKLT